MIRKNGLKMPLIALNQTLKPSQILIIKDGPVSKGILKLIRNYIAKDFKRLIDIVETKKT